MNCANCSFENAPDARYCQNCGQRLLALCPNCDTANDPDARFCKNCGHQLATVSQPARPTPQPAPTPTPQATPALPSAKGIAPNRLQQYVPKELLAKLEAAQASGGMEGERRIVTMLFCDLQGSTAAAGQLDPEDWREIMNGAFEYLINPVYNYEGTLARLMGDAILAFFGAPIGHEDDPQRAILAGLDILETIQPYRKQVRGRWGIDLNVRVGINTGLVVVGAVGSDLRVEYTAMGDAINLAARMEQTADPGTVRISANTYRLVVPLFNVEFLGEIEVKGKDEPVAAYKVLSRKDEPGRLRGIEGLDAPLIGRDREMRELRSAIMELRQGRGQIVSLMGEAGLGKSRLTAELRQSETPVSGRPAELFWLEGRSLSYETNNPYAPFRRIFLDCFGLKPDQSDVKQIALVKEQISIVMPDQADKIAPFLATMLNVGLSGEDAERVRYLEPPQLRAGLFEAMLTYLEALASKKPLVLVFDDLHWIDPTSLELLEALLPLTERATILILALFRPRRQEPSWHFHETAGRDFGHRYKPIMLKPLDESSSKFLVSNLLHIDDLPDRVRDLILKKAEGNPFFVEEVIRSLLDAGLIVREDDHWKATAKIEKIAVPDTLSGVITARLDRLQESRRRLAQTAAVIGREFTYSSLESIYDVPANLEGGLEASLIDLQRRELILEQSRLPQRIYSFKHVLVQETAYETLLLKKRRELHRRLGEYFEKTAPEGVADIARHFLAARERKRALPYLVDAGDHAAHAYATVEAIEYYSQAIEILEVIPNTVLAKRAYEGLGGAYSFAYNLEQAANTYRQMRDYGQSHEDLTMQVSAMNKLAKTIGLFMGQLDEGQALLEEAEKMARGETAPGQDLIGLAEGQMIQCAFCTSKADFDGAVAFLKNAVEIGRQLDLAEPRLYGLTHIANTYTFMTLFDEAWETAQDARALAEETGQRQYLADLLTFPISFYHLREGNIDLAWHEAERGTEIARQIGMTSSVSTGEYVLGQIDHQKGKYEKALVRFESGLKASREIGHPAFQSLHLCLIGTTYLEISADFQEKTREYHDEAAVLLEQPMGKVFGATAWAELGCCGLELDQFDKAHEYFQKGLNTATAMMYLARPQLMVGRAQLALAKGDVETAAQYAREAQEYVTKRGMCHDYPLVFLTAGQVSAAQGQTDMAIENFDQAKQFAASMGMRPLFWKACWGAAGVLEAVGQHEEAAANKAEARALIDEIAAGFEEEELRRKYLDNCASKFNAVL